jgi:hypothetical protein
MQNPRQQNELRSTGPQDRSTRVCSQPRPKYRLETIIALQRALQNGIPDVQEQQNEDSVNNRRVEPISDRKNSVARRFVRHLLTSLEHVVSAALQRRRSCARFRNSIAGLP